MADDTTTTTDALGTAANQVSTVGNDILSRFKNETGNLISGLSKLGETVSKAVGDLGSIGDTFYKSFKDSTAAIRDNDAAFSSLSKGYASFRALTTTTDLFPKNSAATSSFSTLNDQVVAMGTEWKAFVDILPLGIGGIADKLLKNASAGERAQQQMVSMLSSAGGLNTVFDAQGKLVGDLGTQTLKYVDDLALVAQGNNQTLTSTIAYAQEFNKIPGIMNENVFAGDALGGSIGSLSAALKVMAGSGQSMTEVISAMNLAYEDLGNAQGEVNNKAEKGLMLFATMSSLSKELNLQFGETKGFLSEVAKQFKFVGDNTEAAAKIMAQFTGALRDTGLTSSASLDIIKQMIKGVSDLSIGSKAFISAQTGGPGGLQGSIQIDQLIRQGKTDEVLHMVQQSLKQQFGGKIYTQAEGAQSQEGAAGFTRQRMLLQSGAFGNLVGKGPDADEKATHLLEALASGDRGKFAETGQKALESVAQQGNSIQEQGNTILNKIAVNTELSQLGIQLLALGKTREYFGTGNKTGDLTASLNQETLNNNRATGDKSKRNLTQDVRSDQLGGLIDDTMKRFVSQIASGVQQTVGGGKQSGADVKDSLISGGTALLNLRNKISDQNKNQNIARNIPSLEQLTGGVNPREQARNFRTGTANNATAQQKIEHTTTVKIDLSDDAKRQGFKAAIDNTTVNDSAATNNNRISNSPGN